MAPSDGDPTARRGIALLQNGLKLPSVWRGSLAVDRKIPALGLNLTAEAVLTQNDKAFFTDNLNIKPLVVTAATGPVVGLDGRQRFNGASNSAGANSTLFNEVIRVRNIGEGSTSYYSLTVDRPMKNNWSYNVSYTTGRAKEAQSFGQTVALDGWTRNAGEWMASTGWLKPAAKCRAAGNSIPGNYAILSAKHVTPYDHVRQKSPFALSPPLADSRPGTGRLRLGTSPKAPNQLAPDCAQHWHVPY